MVNVFQKKVLILAVYAGEIMMKNGAEVYRVEDTITRICRACHIDYIEVFATPTGIFVSIDKGGAEDDPLTYVKRISGTDTDLNKIAKVNHFSREFTTTNLSVEAGMERLKEIDHEKPYPYPVRLLGAALIASFFCVIFEGNEIDFLISFPTGMAAYMLAAFLKKYEINPFIRGFCCCAMSAVIAMAAAMTIPGATSEPIIIGTLMIFVPGFAITNSIRDFLSGDMLSGIARMTEAVITAISLAAGAAVVVKLWGTIGGLFI